jgi:hypothetical protein
MARRYNWMALPDDSTEQNPDSDFHLNELISIASNLY